MKLSVIVPIRDASQTATRTLQQLSKQCEDLSAEIIAVISAPDATAVDVPAGVRFFRKEGLAGIPQLRRDALLAAAGEWIVITEDHCIFPAHWLRTLVACCEQHNGLVCGGPVANGRRTVAGWAQYFTRYSAFLPTSKSGPATGLPGNNTCYPRELLFQNLDQLREGFWEAEFNSFLRNSGTEFYLQREACVIQDQRRSMWRYVPLRYRHGRCYGARRIQQISSGARLRLLLLCPTLPFLLFFRIARSVLKHRYQPGNFALALPLLLLYLVAWSAGEAAGYVSGASDSCYRTD